MPKDIGDLRAIEYKVQKVVARVLPCTVGVRIGNSQGSGVIVSEDGYVLTAGHVVEKPGQDVVFLFADGHAEYVPSENIIPANDGLPNPNLTRDGIRGRDVR